MARIEYDSDLFTLEIEAESFDMGDADYVQLLQRIRELHSLKPVSTITYEDGEFQVTLQSGEQIVYEFSSLSPIRFAFSTVGTIWDGPIIVRNIAIRLALIRLIKRYNVTKLELTY